MDSRQVGGEIYQANYILCQFKGIHANIIHTSNEIASHNPESVGVNNGNEEILHECEIDYLIKIKHDGDDHGRVDYIKYIPSIN